MLLPLEELAVAASIEIRAAVERDRLTPLFLPSKIMFQTRAADTFCESSKLDIKLENSNFNRMAVVKL